mmetsp:Transcript_24278/g.53132  ORF Transcript_24278/g.53132 Transcript_24278/m.53132 type:complete len:691 (+) Transcript_24278:143-2215(+)|eukprot:CAMPEP_0168171044 /NCGR_PEP_ID=MMETSP0139_2-20121125/4499_1 /TAXON_ID=44445 /ORGANISM="Pseudo-nitzschia australis, Strain 10249 10 AB" /LENGTH=690 /DNA_ID=CAMNT_0008088579 /DNA_START=124 /DNA_END=2196 /DNA_ORIENTATION=-
MARDFQTRRAQTKRRFRQIDNSNNSGHQQLEVVDDLAHAAQFAIVPPNNSAAATTCTSALAESVSTADPTKKQEDGNEIEVNDDSDDDDSDASIADAAGIDGDKEDKDDDSSDDDESDDEDLAEAMQRMEQATAREEEAGLTTLNAPKTENEVDGYKVPIQELESQLQIRLTVDDESTSTTTATATAANKKKKNITENQLSLAGRIKNYMAVDRTVVVASAAVSPSSSGLQQATGPLDEGSLLVIKKQHAANTSTDDSAPYADTSEAATTLIPLGRIFEVFGPVSQPLYTIRLPSPPWSSKDKQKLVPNQNKISKKNSNKENCKKQKNQLTEAKKVNEKGDDAAVDGNQDDAKMSRNDKEIREGEVSSDNKSPPEMSEKANEATAMEEESSSPSPSTEADTVGKEQNNAFKNEDTRTQPQSILREDKESSTSDKEGSDTKADTTAPGSNDAAPEKVVVDMWAVDGEYAKFLCRNKNIEVYYIQDEAKLIDTGFVMRTSGKGCDASNIYDEEIMNTNEAYYSDDEKEREAKNKKKGAGRKKNQKRNIDRQQQHENQSQQHNNSTRYSNNNNIASTGYYGQPPPPPPPQSYGYGQRHSLPQGFHHHMIQQQQQQQQQYPHGRVQQPHPTHHQYPPGSAFHRQASGAPPPPPPPPPGHNQSYLYQQGAPQQARRQAPPPPPPMNSNEPPAYQY